MNKQDPQPQEPKTVIFADGDGHVLDWLVYTIKMNNNALIDVLGQTMGLKQAKSLLKKTKPDVLVVGLGISTSMTVDHYLELMNIADMDYPQMLTVTVVDNIGLVVFDDIIMARGNRGCFITSKKCDILEAWIISPPKGNSVSLDIKDHFQILSRQSRIIKESKKDETHG